jgi:hypothetical protein
MRAINQLPITNAFKLSEFLLAGMQAEKRVSEFIGKLRQWYEASIKGAFFLRWRVLKNFAKAHGISADSSIGVVQQRLS